MRGLSYDPVRSLNRSSYVACLGFGSRSGECTYFLGFIVVYLRLYMTSVWYLKPYVSLSA